MSDDKTESTTPLLRIARAAMDLPKQKAKGERTTSALTILAASAELADDVVAAHRDLAAERQTLAIVRGEARYARLEHMTDEPDRSADDERLMALGQWVDGVVMRADLAMARMSDPDEDDDTAPFTLKHVLSAIDRLLPIDIDERKAHPLASRVTVWRKAWDHWQAEQPAAAEPDKPAE